MFFNYFYGMDIEDFMKFCKKKQGSELCFPFGHEHMVFKVGDKMFALASIEPFERINLKCDPEKAITLRAAHSSIIPFNVSTSNVIQKKQ